MLKPVFSNVGRALVAALTALLASAGVAAVTQGQAAAILAPVTSPGISPSPALTVFTGANAQPASSVTFTIANTFKAGDTITITLSPNGAAENCPGSDKNNLVTFTDAPSAVATSNPMNGAGDSPPSIILTTGSNSSDLCGVNGLLDVLTLTLPAPVNGSSTSDSFTVTISDISYNVGTTTTPGLVTLAYATAGSGYGVTSGPLVGNANVVVKANATATANNPVSQVTISTTGPVSNIVVTEGAGAAVSNICVTPIAGLTSFAFNGTPTASASPATAGAGTTGTPVIVTGAIDVPITPSTTVATTYTITAVSVADGPTTGVANAMVTTGGTSCASDNAVVTTSVAVFNSAPVLRTAIAGNDADATAIAALETVFVPGSNCVTNGTVVLATDQNFPDALAASYLAGFLHTGILLTPTANLSGETQAAFKAEGVTNVYVVGGPLAISQNTLNQIQATPAYTCGGGTATGSNITVTGPIFGQTQYDTAQAIAVTPGIANVGKVNLSGAYNNAYNDTNGTESNAPSAAGALRTAIIASGLNFPDATAASVIGYHNQFPVLLTDPNTLSPQAVTALQALGIQQVILLGGPLAVSNPVVTAIQALNISVIRIAGQDPTDTAQFMANFELNQSGTVFQGLGWGTTSGGWANTVLVARGDFYADAMTGSVLVNLALTPMLLTENPSTVGPYLTGFLNAGGSVAGIDGLNSVAGYSGNLQVVQPLGGPLALQFGTLTAIVSAVAAG
jgi:putative cell wall-binding protein